MTTEVATSITMVDAIAAMMALLWSQPHGDREIYLSPEASIAATPTIVDAFAHGVGVRVIVDDRLHGLEMRIQAKR